MLSVVVFLRGKIFFFVLQNVMFDGYWCMFFMKKFLIFQFKSFFVLFLVELINCILYFIVFLFIWFLKNLVIFLLYFLNG